MCMNYVCRSNKICCTFYYGHEDQGKDLSTISYSNDLSSSLSQKDEDEIHEKAISIYDSGQLLSHHI